ncbi:hypothetical protein ETB97_007294 [Aspergillus alliaceus]|uniref:Uncharacterized protein n=1 Tax=Petromyces alliaceus TaxID=209559 RepID=A0A8H5ZWE1_PETAA|nr:hypothetical protein ETB97_007294 [Aspergillus burnettii]
MSSTQRKLLVLYSSSGRGITGILMEITMVACKVKSVVQTKPIILQILSTSWEKGKSEESATETQQISLLTGFYLQKTLPSASSAFQALVNGEASAPVHLVGDKWKREASLSWPKVSD